MAEQRFHGMNARRLNFSVTVVASLENGRQLKDNHPLSKFVACLHDPTVQQSVKSVKSDSVIKLPEGIHWLGDSTNFSNELFMRPCYFELLEAKVEYFKLKTNLRVVVYTGTPGIGKSHLCAYVVALKLIEGTVVFFERRPTSTMKSARTQFYRLDLKSGARELDSLKVLSFLEENERVVYIVDGGPPSEFLPPLETQVFASPSIDLFVAKRKSWNYLYLHTRLFDPPEIESCRSLVSGFASNVTTKTVEDWFFVAGGVARVVRKEACDGKVLSSWKQEAQRLVAKTNVESLQRMIAGVQMDTFVPGSDVLFHWRVTEENVPPSTVGSSPEKKSLRRFQRKMMTTATTHSINKEGLSDFLKALEDGKRFTQAAWDFVTSKCKPPRATMSSPLFVFCTTPANFCSEYKTPQSFVNRKRKADEGVAIHQTPQSSVNRKRKGDKGVAIQQIVLEIPIDIDEYCWEGDLRLKVVMSK